MDAASTQPQPWSEQQVEARLRTLLGALDRSVNRVYVIVLAGWILAALLALSAFEEIGWNGWILGGAVGSFFAFALLGGAAEAWLTGRSARGFNALFPESTPERAAALKRLGELRTFPGVQAADPGRGGEGTRKLLGKMRSFLLKEEAALASSLLGALGASPAAPSPPPQQPAAGQGASVARSGGAYDYIPLEPRGPGEQMPGPAAEQAAPNIPLELRGETHEEKRN
jgi:hypothetical protein